MARAENLDRYLKVRSGWYYYYRHIPTRLRPFLSGNTIRVALKTQSAEIARMRRDEFVAADDEYWTQLRLAVDLEAAGQPMQTGLARKRYEIATARALAVGFAYRPLAELADPAHIEDVVRLVLAVRDNPASDGQLSLAIVDAVLGGVEAPRTTISEAMEIYKTRIAVSELLNKSPAQRTLWHATKDRSLRYFVDVVGDLPVTEITREHGQDYFAWWNEQLSPGDSDQKPKKPKTAARHFSDIRKLYTEYFKFMGDESRPNPFRNLNFKGKSRTVIPAFPSAWVQEKIIVRGALDGIVPDLHLAALMLIETGCRPGEIINLRRQDIVLDDAVPHIAIRAREDREVKTETSIRRVPLVGVSLLAAQRAPDGFARYRDKSNAFSAALGAAFRRRGLFPTEDHVIYSFRHAFEKRMQEANIDYALRCLLMGHKHDRPKYGDGGSMAYRRDELLKIAHPVPKDLFEDFDRMASS
ncbi:DUF6538 domain-containing protein [Hyphomonas sp.]|uniref:DUF6538 domain-containing protein n=1 Tax=Hyphomonas sp. TaxID=87 RepID=UPI003561C4B7